jgi:hypothetical protein
MRTDLVNLLLLIGAASVLSSCSPQEEQEPAPSPSAVEATTIPTSEPTLEPTPTKTSIPFATLVGCVYYEGELVHGYFTFKNESGNVPDLDEQAPNGCKTMLIPPGYYEITATYYQGPICSNVICGSEFFSIVIEPNDHLEIDFEVFPRQ